MNFEEMTDKEVLDIANPMMDNLMDASTEVDHARHIKDFSDRMKAIVTEDRLQEMCESYQADRGFFAAREAVAVFKRPDSAAIVWKQFFTKAQGEFVAEMLLIHKDGKFLVEHTMVF